MTAPVCFVDTETTGLDPDRHEIWEVGLILPGGAEYEWQLPVDLSRADPIALNIGRFHERRWSYISYPDRPALMAPESFAPTFVKLTRGLHLAGAVVSFDEKRLERLLRANGECPMWHYHLVDVEALAAGCLRERAREWAGRTGGDQDLSEDVESMRAIATPPWSSTTLSLAVGVNPEDFDRHTALGDARWVKAIYEAVMGSDG